MEGRHSDWIIRLNPYRPTTADKEHRVRDLLAGKEMHPMLHSCEYSAQNYRVQSTSTDDISLGARYRVIKVERVPCTSITVSCSTMSSSRVRWVRGCPCNSDEVGRAT